MTSAAETGKTVQLTFGLLATDKYPKTVRIDDVEETIKRVSERGTYASGDVKVYDTYEKINGTEKLRAFIDFDVKRYSDGSEIPKMEGILLREQMRDVIGPFLDGLKAKYGRIVFGDSSGMKTPAGQYAISFRIWFPCVIGSKPAIHNFAEIIAAQLIHLLQTGLPSARINWEKFFDVSVYKSITKLRLPGCTKQGEKYRPLTIDREFSSEDVSVKDTLITVHDEKDTLHILAEVEVATKRPLKPAGGCGVSADEDDETPLRNEVVYSTFVPPPIKLTDSQFKLLTGLANCCSERLWDDNNERFQMIAALWEAEPSERMRKFIHEQCALKNPGNTPDAIDGQIARAKYGSVLTIQKNAWNADPTGVSDLHVRFFYAWDALFRRAEDSKKINEILYVELIGPMWVRETYSERFVRPFPMGTYQTVLVQSHMGTGKTVQLVGSKKLGVPGILGGSVYPRILILSARRAYTSFLMGELKKEGIGSFQNYMDLTGSLADQAHLVLQMESLHRVADEYVPYDLVVMDEIESLLTQMHSVGTHLANHRRNYETLQRVVHDARHVVAMDAFIRNRSFDFLESVRPETTCVFVQNTYQPYARLATELAILNGRCILPNLAALQKQMLEAVVGSKKRVVYVCTSKEKGRDMKTVLEAAGVSVLFHCGDDTKEQKDKLLSVGTEWAKYQVVIYTSTITVGVSYSDVPVEAEFDELYLYASAGCALPRDIAQALLRVRNIKRNQLWFTIERRCPKPGVYGLKAVTESVVKRKNNPLLSGLSWADTPAWVQRLICHNENESAVSRRFYSQVLREYLSMSGFAVTEPSIDRRVTERTARMVAKPRFEEIEDLEDDEAEEIKTKIAEERATLGERTQFSKHRFINLFEDGAEMDFLEEAWNTFFCSEEGVRKTYERQFWNIVHEKQRDLDIAMTTEARVRYVEQARGALIQQTTMANLCARIGIPHTCVEKVWIFEEFSALVPGILAMEEEVRHVLGLRDTRRAEKETDFNKAADFLKSVLYDWSGTAVKKILKRKQVKGERIRFYDIQLIPVVNGIWDVLKVET